MENDDLYKNVYNRLSVSTDGFTKPEGEISFSDYGERKVALSILSEKYENVDSYLDDNYFVITFNNGLDESKKLATDLQYIPNKTPSANLAPGGFCESIEKHDELNQKLFDGNTLKSEVKDKLLEIVDRFVKNLEEDDIKIKIDDIQLVGSNASYNYTKDSDIDLHLFADLSVYKNDEDLALKLYDAYRRLWNDKYDPTIYGHEVEIYVEPTEAKNEELKGVCLHTCRGREKYDPILCGGKHCETK